MQLTERQERILATVVESYIATAHPVGSAAIVATSGLRVSSATVRHELAHLEEHGLLRQLHTSGGRVPSNEGYRYYVEHLMRPRPLPSGDARTILHQFHQAHSEKQEWLKLAATILASRLQTVGLISAPRSTEARVRHMELIAIHNGIVLPIVVLQDGTVLQEMMALPEPRSQEELSAQVTRLNLTIRGLTGAQIEAALPRFPSTEQPLAEMAVHLLQRAEGDRTPIFHAGLADMLRQPEFAHPQPGERTAMITQRLGHMVEFLHQGVAVQQLLLGLEGAHDVQVVIGGDMPAEGMQDYSFVLGRYGTGDDGSGFLGIVGPTRMQYPRAVSLVRYLADVMTDLMQAY